MPLSLTRSVAGLVLLGALIAACGGNSHSSSKPSQKAKTPAASQSHAGGGSIPQGNGGDSDADNNGGPSDGDGNI
ncbi:MAG: hypothetical protein ACM3ML_00605 [Micromonosporaceae bacterium]